MLPPRVHLAPLVLASALATAVVAQSCPRPEPPLGGFPTQVELIVPVTFSDGYETFGSLIHPSGVPPLCGWPLVVFVHTLGLSRTAEQPLQNLIASQGYAVWSYDVRGHGQALLPNLAHPNAGSTLWGRRERCDLAEQITFVGSNPAWTGLVDASRTAVIGSSQGGAHAWNAAAWSGQLVQEPGRPGIVFPPVACVIATDFVADTVDDWLRGGMFFSSWFVEAISGIYFGVPLDPAFQQTCRAAFIAQDPVGLAATFAAEERGTEPLLATSTVPILYAHAYHDVVDSPLSALSRLQNSTAPHRVLLSTIGHGVPPNVTERSFRDNLTLRWLQRYLWAFPNEVEFEQPHVLAELPLRQVDRDDPTFVWSHAHVDDALAPPAATRWFLHDDFVLRDLPPAMPQVPAMIHQVVDPLAVTFTPTDYLDQPTVRDVTNVLAVCPLQELVYSFQTAGESQLATSGSLHLRVVPDQPQWLLAALLSVQPPEPGAQEVMLASNAIGSLTSTQGIAEDHDFLLLPVAVRIPAGSVVRLRLRNLWLREAPMARALEVAPRFHDFRVDVQYGDTAAGSWLDLPLQPVAPKLASAMAWLDLATAPPVTVTLRGGTVRAGYPYFTTVGLSGHLPGIPFLNDVLRVEADWLVLTSAGSLEAPWFAGFLGFLDSEGVAACTLDLSSVAPLPTFLSGLRVTFLSFVWDGAWAPTGAASNPCDVLLR